MKIYIYADILFSTRFVFCSQFCDLSICKYSLVLVVSNVYTNLRIMIRYHSPHTTSVKSTQFLFNQDKVVKILL